MTLLVKVEILEILEIVEIVDVEKVENRCFFAKKPNQLIAIFFVS